ncbi:MAG TPA: efflux RND transporter periplasmic adaptor subunit [Desulfurivibrionaceae bacterium]|nr:efflux RND transporter periplasmic adaptor subunit [Desulfurivibrionaceae bacterium]
MRCRAAIHALGIVLLLVQPACKGRTPGDGKSLPTGQVAVVAVATEPAGRQQEVAGTVEAVQRAAIAAKATGMIAELPVALGASVPRGGLLVRIAAGESAARLAQAEAQRAQAKRNLEREQRLLAKEAATREGVKALEDAWRVAEAAYREAQAMHGYTVITAPFAGLVTQKYVKAGDLATVGMPLLVLENGDRLQVAAQVPEALVARLKVGDALPVQVPAAGFAGTGAIAELSPAADALSRTATVKINLAAAALRPGQFARVTLPGGEAASLFVPETAISTQGQMERLFVVQEGKASLRLVRTGERRDGRVEVLSGLNPGEQVVVRESARLVDGQPVKVAP